ncbi:conserved hypothetical protein [Haliangium ochraceum DSM 14365]|uniref:Uncharacterized protein n=2 Tax=Haliangium ochraceum TaxID=80816 RepID=D0LUD8_HALO1|nr:conserved hypothetical protein [Haliangium ochraceum DSM 14365]
MARLYISQSRMDAWSAEDRIDVKGDTMTLTELKRSFTIEPAVRFLKVSGDEDDPHELLGKVKAVGELEDMGADHLADSVLFEETAYDVENGFIGKPLPKGANIGGEPTRPGMA